MHVDNWLATVSVPKRATDQSSSHKSVQMEGIKAVEMKREGSLLQVLAGGVIHPKNEAETKTPRISSLIPQ